MCKTAVLLTILMVKIITYKTYLGIWNRAITAALKDVVVVSVLGEVQLNPEIVSFPPKISKKCWIFHLFEKLVTEVYLSREIIITSWRATR